MKKTTAPKPKTPSPKAQTKPHTKVGDQARSPGSLFMVYVLDLTWRLAIVVLVPVVGGYELDKRLNTAPWLSLLGFIAAMIGMALVLRQMLRKVAVMSGSPKENRS